MPKPKGSKWALVVEGEGVFPVDMLRYDQAYPLREADSAKIERSRNKRRIELVSHAVTPTPARWESFGWTIVSSEWV